VFTLFNIVKVPPYCGVADAVGEVVTGVEVGRVLVVTGVVVTLVDVLVVTGLLVVVVVVDEVLLLHDASTMEATNRPVSRYQAPLFIAHSFFCSISV
jgi:hypothetical protein